MSEQDEVSEFFSEMDFDGALEAVFILKQTGIALAAWTQSPVPQEVVSVMAATMWGSIDTMVRTLGGQGPRTVLVEIEDRLILALRVEPSWTLLLIAPRTVGRLRLRHEAQRITERISRVRGKAMGRSGAVPARK